VIPAASAAAKAGPVDLPHSVEKVTPKRKLIVNADDFGISLEVNDAIISAHREGVLTSTSLMVTGEAFDDAVRLARENPRLGVGIHLVTVMGRSALPASEIPSLVDSEGNFSNDPINAGLKYFFSPRARRELRRELPAQFERFKSTGLPLSHVDGHLHLHVHPVIFLIAIEQAAKYGARCMRVPVEDRRLALEFDSDNRALKTAHSMLFDGLARYMRRRLDDRGFAYPARVYGNLQSGRMNESYFLYALEHLSHDLNEIYFHPAKYPVGARLSKEQEQCQTEYETLTSQGVAERIKSLGIRLVSYFDLTGGE
jgi:hopanoid biosynthesis associated protein HpnK